MVNFSKHDKLLPKFRPKNKRATRAKTGLAATRTEPQPWERWGWHEKGHAARTWGRAGGGGHSGPPPCPALTGHGDARLAWQGRCWNPGTQARLRRTRGPTRRRRLEQDAGNTCLAWRRHLVRKDQSTSRNGAEDRTTIPRDSRRQQQSRPGHLRDHPQVVEERHTGTERRRIGTWQVKEHTKIGQRIRGKAFHFADRRGDRVECGHVLVATCGLRISRAGRACSGLSCPCVPRGQERSRWEPCTGCDGAAGLSRPEPLPFWGLHIKDSTTPPLKNLPRGRFLRAPSLQAMHRLSPLCGDLSVGVAAGGKATSRPQRHTRSPRHRRLVTGGQEARTTPAPSIPRPAPQSPRPRPGPTSGQALGRRALLLTPGVRHPGKTFVLPPGPL